MLQMKSIPSVQYLTQLFYLFLKEISTTLEEEILFLEGLAIETGSMGKIWEFGRLRRGYVSLQQKHGDRQNL